MTRIESLLAARLFLSPQRAGDRLYFISNLSGKLSLYAMDAGGSVPEPLLPPDIALQNPTLMTGYSFYLLPELDKLLVMIDANGDENYQPMLVPLTGGIPQPAFGEQLRGYRVHLEKCYPEAGTAYFAAESRKEQLVEAFQARLGPTWSLTRLAGSPWGELGHRSGYVNGVNADHSKVILREGYTLGDNVLRLWEQGKDEPRLLHGTPLEDRKPGESVPLSAIFNCHFTGKDRGLLFVTALFEDTFGLGYLGLDGEKEVRPVRISEPRHAGQGELYQLEHLEGDRFLLQYNIDGGSWGYEGTFDEGRLEMSLEQVRWGQGELSQGVLQAEHYDQRSGSYSLAFSTATSPAQIYTLDGPNRNRLAAHTRERVLGIPKEWMASGEAASYESHDGLQVSARLYLPAEPLGYEGPRPLVLYVHGGPQSQERPDFTWFSMPLIQFLTLKGFGVFVPNVRGSTGYGLAYTKHVDRDWGGKDRLDFVHGLKLLAEDPRLDTRRTGVVGRSYGGYMSLMLAGRHPGLWAAAVDMFGPYDLVTFSERIPPTWKPYYKLAIGDPDDPADRKELVERSPRTHLHQLACPLLVIQGANDPRVVVQESRDLVEALKAQGKQVELLVFEDEGHDVLKFDNRVRCYNAITEFFEQHLKP